MKECYNLIFGIVFMSLGDALNEIQNKAYEGSLVYFLLLP